MNAKQVRFAGLWAAGVVCSLLLTARSYADFVIADDLIVQGSACIGQDCVNGESFGFDTIRLKENNLRIKFDDTSSTASFPNFDWQITANDSANGGLNKFSIEQISPTGLIPFTIEGNAKTNALYVDSSGRIGIGTSTPVVNLHVKSGNTPTLRLEQDGSSGFTAQTWDVAGNETNFFIRDTTNGSKLSFRIQPNAPGNSIFIKNDGNVGLGTSTPDGRLHVIGKAMVEDVDTNTAPAASLHVKDGVAGTSATILVQDTNVGDNAVGFTIKSASAVNDWQFNVNSAGNFQINSVAVAGGNELAINETTGNVTIRKDLSVQGTLTKTMGTFKIDHPLDPANKYLSHSFVESPDMMNIYNGNVTLDENGEARVELPNWFDALNREFRYQLTAIGKASPDLHVAEEISSDRFTIAGGAPGIRVSWQVTGVRKDPYAEQHRVRVEEDKPESERGLYLHPEVYGLPLTKSIQWQESTRTIAKQD